MNDNNTKLCIEVLSDNNVENLTGVIHDAIRNVLDLDDNEDIENAVDVVVTGVSPQPALDIVQYAVSEVGIDTDWNADSFQVFKPNVERAADNLDADDFDSDSAMERNAYRNAADFRNMLLCEGTDDHAAADNFIVVTDDVTRDDVDELTPAANGFLNSLRDHGRLNDAYVAYAGVPAADDSDDAAAAADSDSEAASDSDTDADASDSEPEPSDAEVEDEFEALVA